MLSFLLANINVAAFSSLILKINWNGVSPTME